MEQLLIKEAMFSIVGTLVEAVLEFLFPEKSTLVDLYKTDEKKVIYIFSCKQVVVLGIGVTFVCVQPHH